MCGICGYAHYGTAAPVRDQVMRMQARMAHRGPDSSGLFENGDVILGVRRLSIVDIAHSDQPLYNENKRIAFVYNGMIYNYRELRSELSEKGHRFSTQGDGEVVIHLYEEEGVAGFARLHGMFALALYDGDKRTLHLARDHFGIKPLYVGTTPQGLAFSSEIKPLRTFFTDTLRWDTAGLDLYFTYNYVPHDRTLYTDIKKVMPGQCVSINERREITRSVFWTFKDHLPQPGSRKMAEREAVETLDTLFRRAMERYLYSDVEVGCFLSGGLDSSTLVHYIAEYLPHRLKTFSVGYDDRDFDERCYARQIADRYGTDHHEIECGAQDVLAFLESAPETGDMPVADQAIVSTYLVSKLTAAKVKVALSGDGGDELFMGYTTYTADRFYPLMQHIPQTMYRLLQSISKQGARSGHNINMTEKIERLMRGCVYHNRYVAHASWRTIFYNDDKESLYRSPFVAATDVYDPYFNRVPCDQHVIARCAQADMAVWLPDNNFLRADTFSMCHSLEVRIPFLYLPLVEFVCSLPLDLRYRGGKSKYLFKKLLAGKIPAPILKRKKQGWHIPLSPWLRGPLYGYCRDIFLSDHSLFDTFIDRQTCLRLLDEHKNGLRNHTFRLWGLMVLLRQTIGEQGV